MTIDSQQRSKWKDSSNNNKNNNNNDATTALSALSASISRAPGAAAQLYCKVAGQGHGQQSIKTSKIIH